MIDLAKSSRAKCRTCKAAIPKGSLRFGVLDFTFSSSGSYKWHHLTCAADGMRAAVEGWIRSHTSELPMPEAEVRAAMDPQPEVEAPGAELPDDQLPASLQGRLDAKKPTFPRWARVDTLPRLRLPDGRGMSRQAQEHLLGACKSPPSKKADGALVDEVVEQFGTAAFTDLVTVIYERWVDGGTMRDSWVLRLLRRCDDRIVGPVGRSCANWMRQGGNKNDKAMSVLRELLASGSDTALLQVQQLAQRFAYKGVNNVARVLLGQAARDRGLSVGELEDALVPDGGLDADGTRTLDFGPRQFTLTLDEHLEPTLRNADGEALSGFPRRRSSDDDVKVDQAKRTWDQLRKTLSQLTGVQRARLEEAMVSGRRWSWERWTEHLRRHPLMQHIARRVVWAEYAGPTSVAGTFRIDEEGGLVDVDDEPYDGGRYPIGLLHPVEDPDVAQAWGQVLADYELVAAFQQLGRPVRHVDPAAWPVPAGAAGPWMKTGHIQGVLAKRQWNKHYDYLVRSYGRSFGDRGSQVVLHFEPGMDPRGDEQPQQLAGVSFRNGGSVALADPVVLSEVLTTIDALQGG